MGDITIYLLLDSTLLGSTASELTLPSTSPSSPSTESSSSASTSTFQFQSLTHVIPGDASLVELMDFVLSKVVVSPFKPTEGKRGSPAATILDEITVLDISYHPAKVISPIVKQYTQVSGPRSKTLQSCGWYPSGKLVVLPSPSSLAAAYSSGNDCDNNMNIAEENLLNRFLEWQSRNVLRHEEFAYNNPDAINNNDGKGRSSQNNATTTNSGPAAEGVKWTGIGVDKNATSTKMKPSEIFNAVEQRPDNHPDDNNNTLDKLKPKPKKPRRTEKERAQRLDTLLQNLENKKSNKNKNKKKAVSDKVRTMLLKSRSEGNKKLRMEDRFHLEVVRLWDVVGEEDGASGNGETSYRFFSRQTTAGRVASSVASNLGNAKAAELVVSHPCTTTSDTAQKEQRRYRRLPNTMTLHDAQNAGWVKDFDVVMVRVYSLAVVNHDGLEVEEFGPSKSVLDPDSDDEMRSNDDEQDCEQEGIANGAGEDDTVMEVDDRKDDDSKLIANGNEETQQQAQKQSQQQVQQRIHSIFQSLDENNNANNHKPSKKKKKPVSKQMRHMIMKSKSTGNARLKQDDRVYLEVILFHDNNNDSGGVTSADFSSSYRFFSKRNDIQHIITDCSNSGNATLETEFIVSQPSTETSATNLEVVYQKLPATLTLGQAIEKGHVENFGRVMVRFCSDENNCVSVESVV